MRAKPRRVCVVTSYAAAAEPRGPRHAIAAKKAFPDADIVLVDLAASGAPRTADPELLRSQGIERRTVEFPSRASGIAQLAARKLKTRLGHAAFARLGILHESVFGERTRGLTRALLDIPSEIYIAHNIETLMPCDARGRAARRGSRIRLHGVLLGYGRRPACDRGRGGARTRSTMPTALCTCHRE